MSSTSTDRIDGINTSVAVKAPCIVATIANITLSGTQTIDGVAVVVGDRVLVKNQTTATRNGIYKVSSTAWTRAKDFDGDRDIVRGTRVYVFAGSTQSAGDYILTTVSPIIGTSNLAFSKIAGGGGTGDITGPGSSTDNELVLFSGAAGDSIKSATGTGYVKVISGVMSTPSSSIPNADVTGLGTGATADASTFMLKANNLGDVSSASTARSNLGLGTIATQAASNVAITGGSITGMPTPSASSDVATKGYADGLAQGLAPKAACRVATTAALTATYSNGSSGVGATLTNSGTQAALSIDGVSLSANDRVLVKNQSSTFQNGIYTVTTVGSGSTSWVLTRATDFDIAAEMLRGAWTIVTAGTANGSHQFFQASATPTTVGTDAVTFTDLGAIFLAAGNNLSDLGSTATARTNLGVAIGSNVQAYSANLADNVGTQTFWIPAGAMRPSTTGGCASLATIATSANQPDVQSLDFDTTTQEFAQFSIAFPKQWDLGTVTAKFIWSHASTSTNFGVVWNLQGVAESDGDAIAAAYGTAQQIADTGGTTNTVYVTSATSAITIAGTPANGDIVHFRVARVPADGSDTMAIDARLMGIQLFITTNAARDN